MQKKWIALALVAASTFAHAQTSPVGLWKTIDDDGKTEKSLVRITEVNGVLTGSIEKVFDASKQTAVCEKCEDDRKNKPLVGLQIIRGVKQDADDKALWSGGQVLDPENGKTYKTRLKPIEGGKKLEMRGYLGFFYRTQVWVRAE
jgi:uncharacterized protein (DUF2147 family)